DAAEDGVEVCLADEEGVVLDCERLVGRHEIETDAVGSVDHHERPKRARRREPEDLRQKHRRRAGGGRVNDGGIELNAHDRLLCHNLITQRAANDSRALSQTARYENWRAQIDVIAHRFRLLDESSVSDAELSEF